MTLTAMVVLSRRDWTPISPSCNPTSSNTQTAPPPVKWIQIAVSAPNVAQNPSANPNPSHKKQHTANLVQKMRTVEMASVINSRMGIDAYKHAQAPIAARQAHNARPYKGKVSHALSANLNRQPVRMYPVKQTQSADLVNIVTQPPTSVCRSSHHAAPSSVTHVQTKMIVVVETICATDQEDKERAVSPVL